MKKYTDKEIIESINISFSTILMTELDETSDIFSNRYQIATNLLGYEVSSGYSPVCKSKEDAIKLAIHFLKLMGKYQEPHVKESDILFQII